MMAATVTPRAAQQERLKREKARRSLIAFSEYVDSSYKAARHHRIVAYYLEEVAKYIISGGKEGIGRLMIFEPPRHGKTEQAAIKFPGWLLGKRPDSRIIITSYAAGLATKSSRAVRNMLNSTRYQAVFGELSAVDAPVQLSDDSRAMTDWDLAAPHRGGMVAAGVGGGITGLGADLLVIDDPFKSREEAESETQRQTAMEWYSSTAYTRLEDNGAIVLMNNRWHPDDVAGQLLKRMASGDPLADEWTVVCLPALAMGGDDYAATIEAQLKELRNGVYLPERDLLDRAEGDALWPEKYDADDLKRIAANIGPYDFTSLYQQQPRPAEGAFFGPNDFEIVDAAPEGLQWVRYVDLALSQKATADFNATVAEAMADDGTVYLRDMLRVRGWFEFKERLIGLMLSEAERGVSWGIEDVAFQSLAFQELIRDPRLANVSIRNIRPQGDKVERSRPLQTRAQMGKVKLVRGPWCQTFIAEALDFPKGKHDDQIDTASGGLAIIAELQNQVEVNFRWL